MCRDHLHSDGPWSGCASFNRKPWFPHGSPDEQPQQAAQLQQGAVKAAAVPEPAVEDAVITATAEGLAQTKLQAGASFNQQMSNASSMISAGEVTSSSPPPAGAAAPSPLVPAAAPVAAAVAQ